MEEKSRTEYTFLNASSAIACNLIGAVLGFLNRIVLTHTLSEAYVGVNGLFIEMLTLLSFSELGIGAAMAFTLYRPLAQRDETALRALIRYYQKLYSVLGIVIFCVGLLLIPAFPWLIRRGDEVEHLRLVYLLYLICNVLSYPLLYKKMLLAADQKEYRLTGYLIGAQFAQYITQIAILLTVKNFLLYVLAGCLPTLISNILSARKIGRLYPFLREGKAPPLPNEVRREVNRTIAATTMQKVGAVLINNTDSLLLSSMFSVASVARYSNYNLFCRGVDQILSSFFKGVINSVGNLGAARESDEQVRRVFDIAFFINQWLYGFAAIGLYELLSPFVALCFGENYVFERGVVLIVCINVFARGMRMTAQTFHDSLGLYWHDRYRTLIEAAINLVISIVLARRIGMAGVFVGTLASNLMTTFWIEPCVLFHRGFHAPVRTYFLQYGLYALVLAAAWLLTDIFCGLLRGGNAFLFFARIPLCLLVPNAVFLLAYFKTEAFRGAVRVGLDIWRLRRTHIRAAGGRNHIRKSQQ